MIAHNKVNTLPIGVWQHRPLWAGIKAFVVVWGGVVVIALFQGTLSLKNPAFLFGDPLLCMAITAGAYGLASLPFGFYRFATKNMQIMLVMGGYAIGLTVELMFRWRIEGLVSYQFSDWYHLLMYGPMFYWLIFGLIASYKACTLKTNRWALAVITALIAAWVVLGVYNAQNFGKQYSQIGWPEFFAWFQHIL